MCGELWWYSLEYSVGGDDDMVAVEVFVGGMNWCCSSVVHGLVFSQLSAGFSMMTVCSLC